MNKLHLNGLKVESFVTTAESPGLRGTVMGRQLERATLSGCPVSWNGTCWISCNCTPACP